MIECQVLWMTKALSFMMSKGANYIQVTSGAEAEFMNFYEFL